MKIDTTRTGLSFTLTLVVVGVILLMTALTVITIGGAGLGDFAQALNMRSTEAQVTSACNSFGERIDEQYCSMKLDTPGDCTSSVSSGNTDTATDANCDWLADGTDDVSAGSGERFNPTTGNPEVNVDGDWYDCMDQTGDVIQDTACPAVDQ